MKQIIYFLFLLNGFTIYSQKDGPGPPNGGDPPYSDKGDCFRINPNIDNVINVDCPDKSAYLINITQCNEEGTPSNCNCSYTAELYFENALIEAVTLTGKPASGIFQGKFSDIRFQLWRYQNNLPYEAKIEVKVFKNKYISTNPIKILLNSHFEIVRILKSGQVYSKVVWKGPGKSDKVCRLAEGSDYIQCNPDITHEICIIRSNIKRKEPGSHTFTLNPTIKYKGIELTGLGYEYTLPKELDTNEELNEDKDCISMKGEIGKIVFVGYQIDYSIFEISEYISYCTIDQLVSKREVEIPNRIAPAVCRTDAKRGCPPLKDNIELIPLPRFNLSDCKGNITLNLKVQFSMLQFEWTGPNGFTSDSKDLIDVEYGEYKVKVTNECCESIELTILLCKNLNPLPGSQWIQDGTNCRFCRDVSCDGDPVLFGIKHPCGGKIVKQCVEPDRMGNEEYDYFNKKCFRRAYFNNSEIGKCIVQSEVIETYDPILNACVKKYKCGGVVVETEIVGFPTYGFWSYNSTTKKCEREAKCNGMTFKQEKDPDIGGFWMYNSFKKKCEKQIYCDGSPIFNEFIIKDPTYGDWDYNAKFDRCERDIYCDGFKIFGETDRSNFPSKSSWVYNYFSKKCERKVYCNFNDQVSQNIIPNERNCNFNDPRCPPGQTYCEIYCEDFNTGEYSCLMRPIEIAQNNLSVTLIDLNGKIFHEANINTAHVNPKKIEEICNKNNLSNTIIFCHIIDYHTGKVNVEKYFIH